MAMKDEMIKNFSSFRSLNICFILLGLKLNIKKKMIKYQPQNFAKKIELSMIKEFAHVIPKKEHQYDNLFLLPLVRIKFFENSLGF